MTEAKLRRGDIVVYSAAGDYGKPRPAVIVQSDLFNETHGSLVLCPITSELTGLKLFRVEIAAARGNGLKKKSEVLIDKLTAAGRSRISARVGRLSSRELDAIDQALRTWLDLDQTRSS